MCSTLIKELINYLDSEEGKKNIAEERRRNLIKNENILKYIDKIHSFSKEQRHILLLLIQEKTKNKSLSINNILSIILEYSAKYGELLLQDDDIEASYLIDGEFVITDGFGRGEDYIRIKYCPNEIFAKDINDEFVTVFSPSGKVVVSTDRQLVINDILIQIKQKKLNGYYVVYKEKKYPILNNGHIKGVCIFPLLDEQLKKLTGF